MKKGILLIALLLSAVLPTAGQQQPAPPKAALPDKPEPQAAKPAEETPDYSQEPVVIELQKWVYRFENDGTGSREMTARIKVQSELGVEQYGQLVIGYNSANERLDINYVRVRKADGSVVTAGPDAVQDLTAPVAREAPVYTDYHQKHVTVPGLRPGEVLEYQFVATTQTPLAPGQFWMEHEFFKHGIILDDELEVNVPRGRTIKLKTEPGYEPKISEQGDRRIYRWATSHKEREDDEDKPAEKKKKKRRESEVPDVQLTTFPSWEEVGRWYGGLERERREPSPELRAKAEELTQGKKSDLEKLQAIYDYVAKNFRYVSLSFGLGRYQPHSASEVLANQYGDCKDKHTLLAALADAAGLRADTVLISSQRKLDPDVPSPSQFDHVISAVPLGDQLIWMDTTTELAPFRLLTYNLRKKQALVIPERGAARLMETPADPPVPTREVMELEGSVNDLGKLTAKARSVSRGDMELFGRMAFRRVPSNNWKLLVRSMLQFLGMDAEVSDLKVTDPGDTTQAFAVEFQVSKANFLDWSRNQTSMSLPLAQLRIASADEDTEPGDKPVELGVPVDSTYRLKLQLPAKYTVRLPVPITLSREFGEYHASYKMEGHTLVAERRLAIRWRELPVARVQEYSAFRRAVLADAEQAIQLDSAEAGVPASAGSMKAGELYEAGVSALQSRNFKGAVELLKRVVEMEPKHKSAWNDLGNAYLALRQNDAAIGALQKQIEINPYDQFAYNNLGRTYWQKRDFDKAAESFHKQIEVNPLDKFAHRNLGLMLLEQHRDREALPELEKASSLAPEDSVLLVSLGQAQLNVGQTEEALKSFDRAAGTAPSPTVWNNIAYNLSLKKVSLDRAQQYAESAVTSTAATLRNMSLDRMELEQQGLVLGLASYWDTLGWVYFARGDLDTAEKYVGASWRLAQSAEVGDHLAQIYEKRGLKDKAVQMYALALAAERPVPETRGRLAALVGGEKKIAPLVEKAKDALVAMRTFKLGKLLPGKEDVKAEFLLVVANGPKVEEVRFVSGSEKLKPFAETLRSVDYGFSFPDSTATRLVRRGVLSCSSATGECAFVLFAAEDITAALE
jgi:tetratricopeptide (TPR) repeat protein